MFRKIISPVVGKMVENFGESGTAALLTAGTSIGGFWAIQKFHSSKKESGDQVKLNDNKGEQTPAPFAASFKSFS